MARLLTDKQVGAKLSIHPKAVWARMKNIEDFPRPRKFGTSTRWVESEIDDFIMSLPVDERREAA